MDFLHYKDQQLEATEMNCDAQRFVIAPLPWDSIDTTTARILAQLKIDILPGLKVWELATGTTYTSFIK
jgi:hypothetical protein